MRRYLEFEDGMPATVAFDAHGHLDSSELTFGIGLQGCPRDRESNLVAHRQARSFVQERYPSGWRAEPDLMRLPRNTSSSA